MVQGKKWMKKTQEGTRHMGTRILETAGQILPVRLRAARGCRTCSDPTILGARGL